MSTSRPDDLAVLDQKLKGLNATEKTTLKNSTFNLAFFTNMNTNSFDNIKRNNLINEMGNLANILNKIDPQVILEFDENNEYFAKTKDYLSELTNPNIQPITFDKIKSINAKYKDDLPYIAEVVSNIYHHSNKKLSLFVNLPNVVPTVNSTANVMNSLHVQNHQAKKITATNITLPSKGEEKNNNNSLQWITDIYNNPKNKQALEAAAKQNINEDELKFYDAYLNFKNNPNYADFKNIYNNFQLGTTEGINVADRPYRQNFKAIYNNPASDPADMVKVIEMAAGHIVAQLKGGLSEQYEKNLQKITAPDPIFKKIDAIISHYSEKDNISEKDYQILRAAHAAKAAPDASAAVKILSTFQDSNDYKKLSKFDIKNTFDQTLKEIKRDVKNMGQAQPTQDQDNVRPRPK